MPDDRSSPLAEDGAVPPTVRVAAAERRAARRDATAVADLCLGTGDRLDDRTRAAAALLLERTLSNVAAAVTADAATRLGRAGAFAGVDVTERLAPLLRTPDLVAEAITQARITSIEAGLAAVRPPSTSPTLLVRLSDSPDRVVRARTSDYLVADGRRRAAGGELSPALHRRLAWWVAAALRERCGAAADAALSEAVRHNAADTPSRLNLAMHLAAAVDLHPAERPTFLLDALSEGQVDLFAAVLAQALGIDATEARDLVLDPAPDRLWLGLRAAGLTRPDIARIGWRLCEADHARDVESLPGSLDALDGVTPAAAMRALGVLSLDAEFRAAVRTLDGQPS